MMHDDKTPKSNFTCHFHMANVLINPLATSSQLQNTPSHSDGIDSKTERLLRCTGVHLVQSAGILLKLPQPCIATAMVLFQRFYMMSSLRQFSIKDIGMGSLFLASKSCEEPRKVRDIINVYTYLLSSKPFKVPEYFDQAYYDQREALFIAEMQLLKRLGFQMNVALPYGLAINYLQLLEATDLVQKVWNLINDSLQSIVHCVHPPSTIASACIWIATREEKKKLPRDWWELFDVEFDDLIGTAAGIKSVYGQARDGPVGLTALENYLKSEEQLSDLEEQSGSR
ncbi:Cyclin-L2 [Neolecta irregularis DAH-3]|uniref:Cyclin-L2 n=1 Tax=Neolecta irregularis (strain DAH-3) TaxID=1198029 RepID=A0A1U7LP20_NEOID|nr:Cyclin-L2 [Neolecta irregularis DAH-3]|eukprot:OLL24292.1 Cyclin-L2 [Neolecta irregularis DAH-3]